MLIFNRVKKEPYLNEISFNIKRGEYIMIYNRNRKKLEQVRKLITGREKTDRGIIRLLNYSPGKELIKYELGVVYRENILLNDRCIADNFKFIIQARGLTMDYTRARIKKIMKIVDLVSCLQNKPEILLPHQLVRVNIAGALFYYPSLLLLEDSFYNLDEVNCQALLGLLSRINKLGITIVYLSSCSKILRNNNINRIIYLEEGESKNHYRYRY